MLEAETHAFPYAVASTPDDVSQDPEYALDVVTCKHALPWGDWEEVEGGAMMCERGCDTEDFGFRVCGLELGV